MLVLFSDEKLWWCWHMLTMTGTTPDGDAATSLSHAANVALPNNSMTLWHSMQIWHCLSFSRWTCRYRRTLWKSEFPSDLPPARVPETFQTQSVLLRWCVNVLGVGSRLRQNAAVIRHAAPEALRRCFVHIGYDLYTSSPAGQVSPHKAVFTIHVTF
jgi:hypothetical protein